MLKTERLFGSISTKSSHSFLDRLTSVGSAEYSSSVRSSPAVTANGVGGEAVPLSREDSLLSVSAVVVVTIGANISKFGETFVNGVNTLSAEESTTAVKVRLTSRVIGSVDELSDDNSVEEQVVEEVVVFWLSGTEEFNEFETENRIFRSKNR